MRKLFILFIVLAICVMPLWAQEKDMEKQEMAAPAPPAPPPPLSENEFCMFLTGEWEGWSDGGPMGKVEQWEKVELGLNGQFLLRTSKDKAGYQGTGGMTMKPESNEFAGFWMDGFRGMYNGHGKLEGNTLMMEWNGYAGTYKQTTVKVGDDKYTYTWSFTDPAGNAIEGNGEMTRKKMMTDK